MTFGLRYGRRFFAAIQIAVQIKCGADQRQVSESLWEIAKRLALGPNLLRVQAQMIRISEHLFKQVAGSVQTLGIGGAAARQGLHQPKRAEIECALGALQAV